ncbi:uncharacterized protein TNCV_1866511 [Trichonephila clavipes]|nr:uncharacterized protein TNCV_1866511 [Trichonephila clavipes]
MSVIRAIQSSRCIYQQDNDRLPTARLLQQCLKGYDALPWSARSPDISPIQPFWDVLKKQMQSSRITGELTAQFKDYGIKSSNVLPLV